jgi:alcohol dehydrogenase (cytochrome c)
MSRASIRYALDARTGRQIWQYTRPLSKGLVGDAASGVNRGVAVLGECPDFNGDERKGDNLYTDSVIAFDPKTGKMKWHYQFTPHDMRDWDANETPMLVDMDYKGEARKLLLQGNRNGFFYVLDRTNGKFLAASPFVKKLTWAKEIGSDGRPVLAEGWQPTVDGTRNLSIDGWSIKLDVDGLSSGHGLVLFSGAREVQHLSKNSEWWKQGDWFYGGRLGRYPLKSHGSMCAPLIRKPGRSCGSMSRPGLGRLGVV